MQIYFMKRVTAACICQTLHFTQKEGLEQDNAKKWVQDEVKKYKASMDRKNTKYKVVSEETKEDGSVILVIKKQYNFSPVGNYLD